MFSVIFDIIPHDTTINLIKAHESSSCLLLQIKSSEGDIALHFNTKAEMRTFINSLSMVGK